MVEQLALGSISITTKNKLSKCHKHIYTSEDYFSSSREYVYKNSKSEMIVVCPMAYRENRGTDQNALQI